MSRVSPPSLKFLSATSQAKLNGVPCQRSMYACLWSAQHPSEETKMGPDGKNISYGQTDREI